VATTSTVTVTIIDARLAITLILCTVNFAAILATISRNIVASWKSAKNIVTSHMIFFVLLNVGTVVNFRGESSWAEAAFD